MNDDDKYDHYYDPYTERHWREKRPPFRWDNETVAALVIGVLLIVSLITGF